MTELNHTIKEFLTNYTFNNIEILLNPGKLLKLDEESLEEKLIHQKRGGYCFENNQYFFNLLRSKGYNVSRTLGRVLYGQDTAHTAKSHQVTLLKNEDQLYLVDVGFGPYAPGCLVPLDGKEVKSFNGSLYRINKTSSTHYTLEEFKKESYFSLYRFNLSDYFDIDFEVSNYYTNTHPESKFTTSFMLSQHENEGSKFIRNLTLSEITGERRIETQIESEDELYKIIDTQFSVSYTKNECKKLFETIKSLKKD